MAKISLVTSTDRIAAGCRLSGCHPDDECDPTT